MNTDNITYMLEPICPFCNKMTKRADGDSTYKFSNRNEAYLIGKCNNHDIDIEIIYRPDLSSEIYLHNKINDYHIMINNDKQKYSHLISYYIDKDYIHSIHDIIDNGTNFILFTHLKYSTKIFIPINFKCRIQRGRDSFEFYIKKIDEIIFPIIKKLNKNKKINDNLNLFIFG
jgi:hypothetical protein